MNVGELLNTIELSRRIGECPAEVVIFGIEPARVEMGESLSPALASRLGEYVEAVKADI